MGPDPRKVAGVIIGSLLVVGQTLVQEKKAWDIYWIWALVVSGTSLTACVLAVLLETFRKGTIDDWARGVATMVLAVLWTAGAVPTTLQKPYALTGNGYFGTWVALLAAWLMALDDHPLVKETEPLEKLVGGGGKWLAILFLASLTALLQTAWSCGTAQHWCNGNAGWILVCSSISCLLCASIFSPQITEKVQPHFKVVSLFFLIWWAAGAVVTTFENPYASSYANGYFSCWAAVGTSALLVDRSWGLELSESAASRANDVTGGAPQEIIVLFLASVVTLIAAAIDCGDNTCSGLEMWAISCSGGSLAACFAMIFYTLRGGWVTEGSILQKIAIGLVVWWVLGTGCMTFKNPFLRMSNGYFAAWVALASACRFGMKHVDAVSSKLADLGENGTQACTIGAASLVLLAQAVVDSAGGHSEGRVFAIVCSILSLSVCLAITLVFEKVEPYFKQIVLGLFAWWSLGCAILTFHSPYVRTGNAYFACWFAWYGSGILLMGQFPQLRGYADMASIGAQQEETGTTVQPTVFGNNEGPSPITDPEAIGPSGVQPSFMEAEEQHGAPVAVSLSDGSA